MSNAQADESLIIFSETLTKKQVYLEKLMLNLRRSRGITFSDLIIDLSEEQQLLLQNKIDFLLEQGLLEKAESRLKLTARGLVVENEIVTQLLV